MTPGLAAFIVTMTAIVVLGSVLKQWIKSRGTVHGRSGDRLDAARQVELLSAENAGLKGQLSRLEERIAVLERIVTDDSHRLTQEIEALRLPRN